MLSRKVADTETYLDPLSSDWDRAPESRLELVPTPLGLQPNGYIVAKWQDRDYGALEDAGFASVHDGRRILLRLTWRDGAEDRGRGEGFPDGAALAFPVKGDPVLAEMGSPEAPVHALHWRARDDETRSVLATGIGTSRLGPEVGAAARSRWRDGVWHLVLSRALEETKDAAALRPGAATRIGLAVWNGRNQERAGLKAMTPDWTDLVLEA